MQDEQIDLHNHTFIESKDGFKDTGDDADGERLPSGGVGLPKWTKERVIRLLLLT